MMKKAIVILLIACMLFSVSGCSLQDSTASLSSPAEEVFLIDSYGLQITADSTFYENTGGSFDLQITNDKAFVSIMPYEYIDLPEGVTPQDALDIQNEELFSKRSAVAVVEEVQTQSLSQGTVTYAMYSAERDGVKNYYATYIVDIPDAETFAWVLVTAAPSYLDSNQEYLHDIVCSLTSIS